MNYLEFLRTALDSTQGCYCIIGISREEKVRQTFVEDLEDIPAIVDVFLEKEYNVYFGCSKFKDSSSRKQPNVLNTKMHYLDIDCGEEKEYKDKKEGVLALAKFCEEYGLDLPNIVDSGYGLHCYWIFEDTIPLSEWKHTALKLKNLCTKAGLSADPTATSDESRVLRLPGTKNFKYGTVVPVSVKYEAGIYESYEKFQTAIGAYSDIGAIIPDYLRGERSELTKRLMNDRKNSFEKILKRTINGTGCNQIRYLVENQDGLHYDMWRGGLSIARNCEDWETAIHAISQGHSGYDREQTEIKAEDTLDKPYKCTSFENLNPKGCKKCPHKGEITSPIQLGMIVEFSKEGDTLPTYEEPESAGWESAKKDEGNTTDIAFVPKLPEGYFRGKSGGIYIVVKGEDGDTDDVKLVYENDLFVIKRMHDYEKGELVLVRASLPKDGPVEFIIPLAEMNSKDDLRKILASKGVIFMPSYIEAVMRYLVECTKMQQNTNDAEVLRQSMGWVDDDTKFIWGTVEISGTNKRYSPPSSTTTDLVPYLQSKGDFETWKKIAMVYDRPGFEPHAFAFFSAFGAPLMKFSAYKGAFINLIHPDSGTGKSTILRMICSVFGHPFELLSKEQDTLAHKFHRMGLLNNIAYCCDELTNAEPHAASNLIYGITHGKGAGRMQGSVNAERKNNTTWSTIGIGSANKSMFETLLAHRDYVSGEIMRLMEYKISDTKTISKDEAYELFDVKLHENYGWAGLPYVQYVLNNRDEVEKLVTTVQSYIDKTVGFSSKHRFWSAVMARNIAGASIAKNAGVIDNNIANVLNWAVTDLGPQLLESVRAASRSDHTSMLGQFLNDHFNDTLIINSEKDSTSGLPKMPVREVKNKLLVRVEPDTGYTYILSSAFRAFCTEKGLIFKEVLNDLRERGIYIQDIRRRLGSGTKMDTPPVWAMKLNYSISAEEEENDN